MTGTRAISVGSSGVVGERKNIARVTRNAQEIYNLANLVASNVVRRVLIIENNCWAEGRFHEQVRISDNASLTNSQTVLLSSPR